MARNHEAFEWDRGKAESNLRKHGVSFEDAQVVLADPQGDVFHVEEADLDHDDEDRLVTTASSPERRSLVLVIVWTMRGPVTRIISARRATTQERNNYEQRHSI